MDLVALYQAATDRYYSKPGRPTTNQEELIGYLRSRCGIGDKISYTIYNKDTKSHIVCRGILEDINGSYFRTGGKWYRFDKNRCISYN